jgi:hypothetical protein
LVKPGVNQTTIVRALPATLFFIEFKTTVLKIALGWVGAQRKLSLGLVL